MASIMGMMKFNVSVLMHSTQDQPSPVPTLSELISQLVSQEKVGANKKLAPAAVPVHSPPQSKRKTLSSSDPPTSALVPGQMILASFQSGSIWSPSSLTCQYIIDPVVGKKRGLKQTRFAFILNSGKKPDLTIQTYFIGHFF